MIQDDERGSIASNEAHEAVQNLIRLIAAADEVNNADFTSLDASGTLGDTRFDQMLKLRSQLMTTQKSMKRLLEVLKSNQELFAGMTGPVEDLARRLGGGILYGKDRVKYKKLAEALAKSASAGKDLVESTLSEFEEFVDA